MPNKHSKGPWHVIPADRAENRWIVGMEDETSVASCAPVGPWISAEVADANTRLIAAAPDLLALCRQMADWLRPEVVKEPDRTFFWKLVEVIRKAEGEQPLFAAADQKPTTSLE